MHADGGAEGVHALQRLRQEGSQAHLQDGRYLLIYLSQHFTGSVFHCNASVFALIRSMPVTDLNF